MPAGARVHSFERARTNVVRSTHEEEQMTSTLTAPPLPQPDLYAVKRRQQQTWASGDFAVVAARIVLVAEQLCDAAALHACWRVLDVAPGSANGADAAARLVCQAVGVFYVPGLLELGPRRVPA